MNPKGNEVKPIIMNTDENAAADLRLVICEPVFLHQIDEDYWADPLADDGELPEAVKAALKALNLAISEAGPVSWEPGKFAVDLDAVTVKEES